MTSDPLPGAAPASARAADPAPSRTFGHLLAHTAVANLTTGYVWWALTFWAYLQTRSVLVTGVVGGAYMLLAAVSSVFFGSVVDHHRKLTVLRLATTASLGLLVLAGAAFLLLPERTLLDLGRPWFWAFAALVLSGAVLAHLRTIALSTAVTILVPVARRAQANGLVGAVQGIGSVVTGVFSGLSVGTIGMGGTLLVAVVVLLAALVHAATIRFTEDRVAAAPPAAAPPAAAPAAAPAAPTRRGVDLRGSVAVIRSAPGLLALLVLSTFNNLVGGLYLTLVDPYGLELFPVEAWGLLLGLASTGFLVGGGAVARFGLGTQPLRTMLLALVALGVVGATFTIRESGVLCVAGIFLYMCLVPVIEAAEQTVVQRVVPLARQGRVLGIAQALENAAAPLAAFAIAPLAQLWILPWARTDAGRAALAPMLGDGDARGIALVFLAGGSVMAVVALLGLRSRAYRRIARTYREAPG